MKFLMIKRIEAKTDSAAERRQSQQLQQLVKDGLLEQAWLLRDGGHVCLASANEAGEPAMPPADPSEAAGRVEIFPVTNALDFLAAAAPETKAEARG